MPACPFNSFYKGQTQQHLTGDVGKNERGIDKSMFPFFVIKKYAANIFNIPAQNEQADE
jgi:hypothetical protein